MSSSVAHPQFNRTAIYLSLGLAVLLIVGALIGARVIFDRAINQPVAMSPVPAPLAESTECLSLIDALPEHILGHDRAEIAEPVPAGTAAWQSGPTQRVTLRCGVTLPYQYNDVARTTDIAGSQWLRVDDMTPESTLSTWYSTDREPVVAVTADDAALGEEAEPVSQLGEAVASLPQADHEPAAAPLADLEPAGGASCPALIAALPYALADSWELESAEGDTGIWVNEGSEPVVLRCGVAPPPNYRPGERLTQIDEIPWFEDAQLVNGSTASTWYALGRDTDIAVSVPQSVSAEVLPQLGSAIAAVTPAQPGR